MILYFLIACIYVNLEKLYKKLNLDSQHRTITRITKYFCDYLYNIKYYIYHNITDIKQYNTILLVCNHINYLDNMVLMRYCIEYLPEYTIHFIYGESSNQLPFIKEFLGTYHIPIKELNDDFTIELKLNLLNIFSKKKIIILFPEGKLLLQRYKFKSINFCKKYDTVLDHLLCPYITGFDVLRKYCDIILDTTILYSNKNDYVNKFNIYGNFLISNLSDNPPFTSIKTSMFNFMPRSVHVFSRLIDTNNSIIEIWEEKDRLIKNIITSKYKITPNKIINKNINDHYYFLLSIIPISYTIYKFFY